MKRTCGSAKNDKQPSQSWILSGGEGGIASDMVVLSSYSSVPKGQSNQRTTSMIDTGR